MKKRTHYLTNEISISKIQGVAACGIYVSREKFGDDVTSERQDVTCGNCLRSHAFKQTTEQQTCGKCGRIVGCDYRGRKCKCKCSGK